MTGQLTARGVKTILTRAGVDQAELEVTDTGRNHHSVQITGPEEARAAAWSELMDHGLACAPYPDRDLYSRSAADVRAAARAHAQREGL